MAGTLPGVTAIFGVEKEVFRQRRRGRAMRAVSAQVRSLPQRLVKDAALRRKVKAAEEHPLRLREALSVNSMGDPNAPNAPR